MAETRATLTSPAFAVLHDPCIICKKPVSVGEVIGVEMNVDVAGNLHAFQDNINQAQRVTAIAHVACYSAWYRETYGSPFIMSGHGT